MAQYSILINAVINQAQLQQQIDSMSNTGAINIPVNMNTQAIRQNIQQIQSQIPAGGMRIFNQDSGVAAIEEVKAAFSSLISDVQQINKVSVLADKNGEFPTQGIVDYTNSVGIASRAVLQLKEDQTGLGVGQGEWVLSPVKYTQNIEKSIAALQQVAIWQNKISSMQVGKEAVFDTTQVKTDLTDLMAKIESFGSVGGATAKEVSAGFSQLSLSIKQAEADTKALAEEQAYIKAERAGMDAESAQGARELQAEQEQLVLLSNEQAIADEKALQDRIAENEATQKTYADRVAQVEAAATAEQSAEEKVHQQKVKDWLAEQKQRTMLSDAEIAAQEKENAAELAYTNAENKAREADLLAEEKASIALDNRNTKIQKINSNLEAQAKLYPQAMGTQEMKNATVALDGLLQGYKAGTISENQLSAGLVEYNNQLKISRQQMVGATGDGNTFGNMAETVWKKFLIWSVGMGLIMGTLSDIKSGIQYIEDLNKVMTDTQIVTGQTTEQIQELANTYNKLGTELGVTTLEVAKGALEWQRAGYSAADTMKLLTASTMQATLGNMDSAESTDRLISTLHGYKLGAEDAMGVIDKLISLDNAYATSVNEISSAMSYGSSVANAAGVSYSELASYISVVSATTRLSAETIGTAMKTILTRFENVKAGVATDEFGEDLNQVEKVLRKVGIQIRDSTDSFRPMGEVIDDVAKSWANYSEVQRAQISTAIAGTRQQNVFVAGKTTTTYGNVWMNL